MEGNFWYEILIMILEALVPAAIIVGGVLLKNWLKKKGATEEQLMLLDTAYDYLVRAVNNTNQVWVDALKSSGGRLTEEQQAEARKKTEEAFKAMLTDAVELAIKAAYGSVEKWLEANMEAAVGEVKALKA
jgi:hypothetical protein